MAERNSTHGTPGAWTGNPAAGTQYVIFQTGGNTGILSQGVTFPVSGDYALTFGAARRNYSVATTLQVT